MRWPRTYPDAALLLVRLATGTVFMVHGYPKVADLSRPIGMAHSMGMEPAAFFGVALAVIEFGGGLLVLLGLGTRVAAFCILVTQVVAVKAVHWHCGYRGSDDCTGFEFNFVLLCGLLALVLAGAGAISGDRALFRASRRDLD